MISQRAPGAQRESACALGMIFSRSRSKQNRKCCLMHKTNGEQCCRSLHMGNLSLPACCWSVGPLGQGGG